uniref:Ricin B lectin domain-containing protein n=1 Tax=Noctiluca scintillans TaxID=2966 RepID=A0A7S1FIA9_NOCSC|mmetsp:Transcript_63317/g.167793  ORF Transcript_63317/g.167793 Transcript_63317/m.167793 type:complete len:667 (+) Transcript_63317:78-2078(+)
MSGSERGGKCCLTLAVCKWWKCITLCWLSVAVSFYFIFAVCLSREHLQREDYRPYSADSKKSWEAMDAWKVLHARQQTRDTSSLRSLLKQPPLQIADSLLQGIPDILQPPLPHGVRLESEDRESASAVWEVLPGANEHHMHGLLGRRQNGTCCTVTPVTLPATSENFTNDPFSFGFGYSVETSDSLPLSREEMDQRSSFCVWKQSAMYSANLPSASVIIVFHNEAFTTLVRSVHSVLDYTPPELLTEIIVVDDASVSLDNNFDEYFVRLQDELTEYLYLLPKVRLIRLRRRRYFSIARMEALWRAQGEAIVFLDPFVEVTPHWIEPLLERLHRDREIIAMPAVDDILTETFAYQKNVHNNLQGFNFLLEPVRLKSSSSWQVQTSPGVGTIFAVNRDTFLRVGGYDAKMPFDGATEGIELGIRFWTCSGRVEFVPCSHVGRLAVPNRRAFVKQNAVPGCSGGQKKMRIAEAWMDQFGALYKLLVPRAPTMKPSGISQDRELRHKLQCKDFSWFVENVPQFSAAPGFSVAPRGVGALMNPHTEMCFDTLGNQKVGKEVGLYLCHRNGGSQAFALSQDGRLFIGTRNFKHCVIFDLMRLKMIIRECDSKKLTRWSFDEASLRLNPKDMPESCFTVAQHRENDFRLQLHRCYTEGPTFHAQRWRWEFGQR